MQEDKQSEWAYSPEGEAADSVVDTELANTSRAPSQPIVWTASEFIHRHKGFGWYSLFFIAIGLVAALVFLLTRDYASLVFIILAGIIFVIIAPKKPRELNYELNEKGIQIGSRFYDYGEFKSFDLVQEDGIKSINLIPLKRFLPEISVYFPPEQETLIVTTLAGHLPHDEYREKGIDKLIRKLHF